MFIRYAVKTLHEDDACLDYVEDIPRTQSIRLTARRAQG
jgi:hypothetical protein